MISVDRQNRAGLVKLLKDTKRILSESKRALAIFPEGTRAKDQKLLPFKTGTKFLAEKLKLRVQPVVITGSKHLLNEHNRTAHNATVRVIYLDPIDVAQAPETWYEDMRTTMQRVIDEEYERYGHAR
jgi:1-acyl-sn-glycerol-3-phosphate acyltransferase